MRNEILIIFLLLTGSAVLGFGQFSSNLPIVVVTTPGGLSIPNEPKITADMKIIHNGTGQINHVTDIGNVYSGRAGIEIRGRYSASLPQKPYGFETRDEAERNSFLNSIPCSSSIPIYSFLKLFFK